MIGEWQEAEPEIGQVAMVHSISRGNFLGICRLNRSGDKAWYDENSGREYDLDKVDEWAPITTPEEQRLKAENEELKYWIHNTGGPLIEKLEAEVKRLNFDMGRLGGVLKEAGKLIDSIGEGRDCPMVNRIRDVLMDTEAGGADHE